MKRVICALSIWAASVSGCFIEPYPASYGAPPVPHAAPVHISAQPAREPRPPSPPPPPPPPREKTYRECEIFNGQVSHCGTWYQGKAVVYADGAYRTCDIFNGRVMSCGTWY